jgi:hypothetical protein
MSAPAIKHTTAPAPLDVLTLRAWARAYLWSIGELTLHEAGDVLWQDAEAAGLIELVGADGIQKILSDAFVPFREAAP